MEFQVRLGAPDGRIFEEVREGTDVATLRRDLEERGYHVFDARPRRRSLRLPIPFVGGRKQKIPAQDFLVFNQELATLLKAGLPLLQALEMMLERMRHPEFRAVLTDIRDQVESGAELSVAFESHADHFPRLYPSLLKAGERSGDLEKVIRRFVRYQHLVLDARRRVGSALVYPVVLICLSLVMMAIMGLWVVPRFSVFYQDLQAELPLITRVTLAVSFTVRDNILVILALAVVGGVALAQWLKTSRGRLALDRLKLRLPFVGRIAHNFAVSEYCRALATLVDGGLPLVPSLEIATQSVGNSYVRERLHPAIEMVQEGRPVNEALGSSDMLDHTAVDMVKVGEATGTLGVMLSNVSDFLDQEMETKLQRFLTLLEPIMLVIMGLVIGLLLVSVYMPMFSILGQVQG